MGIMAIRPSGAAWRAGVLALVMLQGGCAVGIVSVRTPERPTVEGPSALSERVSFDACIQMDSPLLLPPLDADKIRDARRKRLAARVRSGLSLMGIEAELVAQAGSPARFTITEDVKWKHDWTVRLSMLTFSVLPGYAEEVHRLQVSLSEPDSREAGRIAHLQYESAVRNFIWLPLIVHPDFIGSMNGAWESAKAKNASEVAFSGMIQRLADDLRVSLGRDGALSSWSEEDGVACPQQ
jgi:hypothetical protein